MKSLMPAVLSAPQGTYSDLRVLRSGAGWYIGTVVQETGEPGSRDTCYFANETTADFALELLKRMRAMNLAMRKLEATSPGEVPLDLSDAAFSLDFAGALYMCGLDAEQVGYRLEP